MTGTERSRIVLEEMQEMMESLSVLIEEHFDNDPAFRKLKQFSDEMKTELEEVLELYE